MRCLESTRADQIKRFSDPFDAATDTRLPGEQYSLNEQCELALGKGYKAYTSAKAPFQVNNETHKKGKQGQRDRDKQNRKTYHILSCHLQGRLP